MQQTVVSPIFSFLNADAHSLPLLNMAGPITGLIVGALATGPGRCAGAAASPAS
jgi:hypothetical protein